jgi:serine/threonine protein kinase
MTLAGVIMGTAAYMSPEQARGKAVDKRCDIWAFGCVLFEMLTRTRAFDGEEITDVMMAVMRDEPNWSLLPANTPAAIRRLLRRSLAKDRKRRLSDMTDVRLELDEGATEGSGDGQVAATPRTSPTTRASVGHRGDCVSAWTRRDRDPRTSPTFARFADHAI